MTTVESLPDYKNQNHSAANLHAIVVRLDQMLVERRNSGNADTSYVARLYAKGDDAILKKIGEEATETVLAAKDVRMGKSADALVYECADLWFHSMVMLTHFGLSSADVLLELERRMDTSGLEEKARRKLADREASDD